MDGTQAVEQAIRRRIDEINRGLQTLQEERRRLERALAALDAGGGRVEKQPTPRARSQSRAQRTAAARNSRAARGTNKEAIVQYVRKQPHATARQIADGTGIAQAVVYSTAGRLVREGKLQRRDLPDRQVGYQVAEAAAREASANVRAA